MTPETARGLRQILYTVVLVVFLRACTPWFTPEAEPAQESTKPPVPTIRVEVYPRFTLLVVGHGTASVRIKVTVPRNPQNRVVCVAVDGPVYRSSCWEHDGSERYRQEFLYPELPAGDYVALGELQWVEQGSGERKTSVSRYEFRILGGE